MKYASIFLLTLLANIAAAATPPDQLTLSDLVNHPDRWPATVTLPSDITFSNGMVVHQGQQVGVAAFDGTNCILVAQGNFRFRASAADVGLLDAANQAWAALTPAQRAIDPDSLAADMTLWPVQVKTNTTITCSFGSLPPGTSMSVVTITNKGTDLAWPNSPNRLNLGFNFTDAIAQARQLALLDPDKRPSRIAAALQGIMVDSDGNPYKDDHLQDKKMFALYFGANWCAPCHSFSPGYVSFMTDALAQHPDLAAVFMNEDPQLDQMLGYMKDEKMPFPGVPQSSWQQNNVVAQYAGKIIPDLVIIDRFGKILVSREDPNGQMSGADDALAAFKTFLAAQPATQQ
jgi:thiol-disulfide isomerase/thioredoxin